MALVLKKEQEELFVTQYLDLRELRTNTWKIIMKVKIHHGWAMSRSLLVDGFIDFIEELIKHGENSDVEYILKLHGSSWTIRNITYNELPLT